MNISIRQANREDVMQISKIIVEDWQIAYRGIIDDDFLDSLSVEDRYDREINRYQEYIVAVCDDEVLGCAWATNINEEHADCEIIALYVRYAYRGKGIGKQLIQNAMEQFQRDGKKTMIIWCLKENLESRKFYEKMGGKEFSYTTHKWGEKDYDMVSYLYELQK